MHLTLTKLISAGQSFEGECEWLKFKAGTGDVVVFWGSPADGVRNVCALRHQPLPLVVELLDPEDCNPDFSLRNQYDCTISVPEHCGIYIEPEF